jgi:hypothetical protein
MTEAEMGVEGGDEGGHTAMLLVMSSLTLFNARPPMRSAGSNGLGLTIDMQGRRRYLPNRVTRDLAARMNSSVLMLPLASTVTFSKDLPWIDSSQEADMMIVWCVRIVELEITWG